MPHIIITHEAHLAIRSMADNPFQETGTKLANGMWRVPVSSDVFDRLYRVKFPNESMSDVILRAIAAAKGKLN